MMNRLPLSLYVHIPFCERKCLYCDFLSTVALEETKEAYVRALLAEMEYWREEIQAKYEIATVFIGGGTPTCLNADQMLRLGRKIQELCDSGQMQDLEFTVEANPGTVSLQHIQAMKEIGVNRVSLGLQSAKEDELKLLGRIHTYRDFVRSYELLRKHGFCNINIDVMADIPGQTIQSYRATLQHVLSLEPEHISSYSLIVEEGTPFYQMWEEGKLLIPDEEADREMYEMTGALLRENGYRRYEISNYAKEGMECCHNLTYWRMGEYLGTGLGASSFLQGCRFSNIRQMDEYVRRFDSKACMEECGQAGQSESVRLSPAVRQMPCSVGTAGEELERKAGRAESFHRLSGKEEMEEYVFLGLRTMQGISYSDFFCRFGVDFRVVYQDVLDFLIKKCLLAENGNHDRISLTGRGIDVSNIVLAEFLLD